MLGLFLEIDQCPASWLIGELKELCPDPGTLTCDYRSQSEQFYQHAVLAQCYGPVYLLASFPPWFRNEPYTPYFSCQASPLATVVDAELSVEH